MGSLISIIFQSWVDLVSRYVVTVTMDQLKKYIAKGNQNERIEILNDGKEKEKTPNGQQAAGVKLVVDVCSSGAELVARVVDALKSVLRWCACY